MRYLKVLLLALCFFVAMIFMVQNTPVLSQALQLKIELFGYHWTSAETPLYVLIMLAFLVGAVLPTMYFFLEKVRLSSQVRTGKSKIEKLEKELNTLRNMPLESASITAAGEEPEIKEEESK